LFPGGLKERRYLKELKRQRVSVVGAVQDVVVGVVVDSLVVSYSGAGSKGAKGGLDFFCQGFF
jgi:hypothetical protein